MLSWCVTSDIGGTNFSNFKSPRKKFLSAKRFSRGAWLNIAREEREMSNTLFFLLVFAGRKESSGVTPAGADGIFIESFKTPPPPLPLAPPAYVSFFRESIHGRHPFSHFFFYVGSQPGVTDRDSHPALPTPLFIWRSIGRAVPPSFFDIPPYRRPAEVVVSIETPGASAGKRWWMTTKVRHLDK